MINEVEYEGANSRCFGDSITVVKGQYEKDGSNSPMYLVNGQFKLFFIQMKMKRLFIFL